MLSPGNNYIVSPTSCNVYHAFGFSSSKFQLFTVVILLSLLEEVDGVGLFCSESGKILHKKQGFCEKVQFPRHVTRMMSRMLD